MEEITKNELEELGKDSIMPLVVCAAMMAMPRKKYNKFVKKFNKRMRTYGQTVTNSDSQYNSSK